MFRTTVDGKKVDKYEQVWEIMYRYVNPEVSLAYPQETRCDQVPDKVKIWHSRSECLIKCMKINKEREPSQSALKKILPL